MFVLTNCFPIKRCQPLSKYLPISRGFRWYVVTRIVLLTFQSMLFPKFSENHRIKICPVISSVFQLAAFCEMFLWTLCLHFLQQPLSQLEVLMIVIWCCLFIPQNEHYHAVVLCVAGGAYIGDTWKPCSGDTVVTEDDEGLWVVGDSV